EEREPGEQAEFVARGKGAVAAQAANVPSLEPRREPVDERDSHAEARAERGLRAAGVRVAEVAEAEQGTHEVLRDSRVDRTGQADRKANVEVDRRERSVLGDGREAERRLQPDRGREREAHPHRLDGEDEPSAAAVRHVDAGVTERRVDADLEAGARALGTGGAGETERRDGRSGPTELNGHSDLIVRVFWYQFTSIDAGSSISSFTRTRKSTACWPSMIRWSYDSATYIIGRISTLPPTATGRSWILCRPRMPTCG